MVRILILGGGFGGVETYRRLHKLTHRRDDISITLVNRSNFFWFTPMLHEVATGSVAREHVVEPLRDIVSCCTNRFIEGEVERIDLKKEEVWTSRGAFGYDFLVVALGSVTNFCNIPGAQQYAWGFRTVKDGIALRNRVVRMFEEAVHIRDMAKKRSALTFAIVGGGLTGTELACQLADWLCDLKKLYKELSPVLPKITLLHSGDRVLSQLSLFASKTALRVLKQKHVDVKLCAPVTSVDALGVNFGEGRRVTADTVVWTSGFASPLPDTITTDVLDERGWIIICRDGRVKGYANVFAVGDVACSPKTMQIPQTAQAATALGRQVADNIYRLIEGRPTESLRFKSRGTLLPLGDWNGIAEFGPLKFSGKCAWWLRRTVFVQRLWSWTNRIRVVVDWTIDIFRPRDTSEL